MTQADPAIPPQIGFKELVVLGAMLMALNALAIDSMLPALPAIGEALNVADANQRQWVVTAYLLGFGLSQIVYGPLSDRYGRRPVLFVGVGLYVAFSLMAALAWSFETLMAARVLQGEGLLTDQSHDVIIGTGAEKEIRRIEVTFPSGKVATIDAPAAGSLLKVEEPA